MAEKESIADNPFSALFPSLNHVQLYIANKQLSQEQSATGIILEINYQKRLFTDILTKV